MHRNWNEALDLLLHRVATTYEETGETFPYIADPETGNWQTTNDGNWCGGHWIDALRITADRTGEDQLRTAAEAHTQTMLDRLPQESMFYGMNTHYAGFRAYERTGADRHRQIGLDGAEAMIGYFDEQARQIPLGTLAVEGPDQTFRGPASEHGPPGDELGAVDAVYVGLAPLWEAARETGESRYRDVAISHCDRHLDWYVRYDGSTWHHVHFDSATGEYCRAYNELAYSNETCWARGLGWHIAGLSRAYIETGATRYRLALESAMRYYDRHTDPDLVPYWDVVHPDRPEVPRDTSCAVLAADGLTRLPSTGKTATLRDFGEDILQSVVTTYLTPRPDGPQRPEGVVLEGCFNGPSGYRTQNELVWSTYYLLRTLHRLVPSD
jgi:unsaturated chondroitin disaccharide hydrolase